MPTEADNFNSCKTLKFQCFSDLLQKYCFYNFYKKQNFLLILIIIIKINGENRSQQFSDLCCQVQRYVGNVTVFSVSSFRRANGVRRPVFRNISLKGRRRLVFSALGFNRYDFRALLNQKINFPVLAGVIPGFYLKLAAKLLQNVILRKRAFELIT